MAGAGRAPGASLLIAIHCMNARDIVASALRIADLTQREAYLDEVCGDNPSLRAEVEQLLALERQRKPLLERPLAHIKGIWKALAGSAARLKSSAPQVHLVEGSAPHFADEMTLLLRQRLIAMTGIMWICMLLALLSTLTFPFLLVRIVIVALTFSFFIALRSNWEWSPGQLRSAEIIAVAATCLQMSIMPSSLMLERARAGDAATMVMDYYYILGTWALFLMGYGLLIPNSWQRALVVIGPVAVLPYVNVYALGIYEPKVAAAFASLHHGTPVPLTLIAAIGGLIGAHSLYSIRRQAFKAQKFGQYRLIEQLGGGGMGVVYRAEHQLLKRPCAIKLIRPGIDVDAMAIARFEREVRATAQLSHWNTVEIYDYGRTDEGVFYYVMELLPGMSLSELVESGGPLPPERIIYLLRQVCGALREAHGQGLIHRDIKPANIFAAERGGQYDIVKLLDFGLVKVNLPNDPMRFTQQGMISGSPPYMSPEQAAASDKVDARSDIYSLGAVAYALATGGPPFRGLNPLEVLIAHARDPVEPPSRRRRGFPRDLELVILQCLEKQPENRYPDVVALDHALAACRDAHAWGPDQAADWWHGHLVSTGSSMSLEATSSGSAFMA